MTKHAPKPRPLAKQFKALLAYRSRPGGPYEPLGTNSARNKPGDDCYRHHGERHRNCI